MVCESLPVLGVNIEQILRLGRGLEQHQCPRMTKRPKRELPHVGPLRDHRVEGREDRTDVGVRDSIEQLDERVLAALAEQPLCVLHCDVAAQTPQLVESRQRVPRSSFSVTCDNLDCIRVDVDALALCNIREQLDKRRKRHPAKVKALSSGHDSGKHLVCFGSREHEDDVVGRFLECLEQCVEGLSRQHMDLVDDVDLLAPARGRERNARQNLAGLDPLRSDSPRPFRRRPWTSPGRWRCRTRTFRTDLEWDPARNSGPSQEFVRSMSYRSLGGR